MTQQTIPLLNGPVDVSEIHTILNNLIIQINSGFVPATFNNNISIGPQTGDFSVRLDNKCYIKNIVMFETNGVDLLDFQIGTTPGGHELSDVLDGVSTITANHLSFMAQSLASGNFPLNSGTVLYFNNAGSPWAGAAVKVVIYYGTTSPLT